jgi:hypothetical protein
LTSFIIDDEIRDFFTSSQSSERLAQQQVCAQSRHPTKDNADIQFSIAHEKKVMRIPGLNF